MVANFRNILCRRTLGIPLADQRPNSIHSERPRGSLLPAAGITGIRVHCLGAGSAMRDAMHWMMESTAIREITVQTRDEYLLRGRLNDLKDAHPKHAPKIAASDLRASEPDILIISCGRPGATRNATLGQNLECIIGAIGDRFPRNSFVIVVTNPVDIVTEAIRTHYALKPGRIVGIGGDTDARRFALHLGVEEESVTVLGAHDERTAAVLVDGHPIEFVADGPAIRSRIHRQIREQVETKQGTSCATGKTLCNLLETLTQTLGRRHLLSIHHPKWRAPLTWPVLITLEGARPLAVGLPPDIREQIDAISVSHRGQVSSLIRKGVIRRRQSADDPMLSPLRGDTCFSGAEAWLRRELSDGSPSLSTMNAFHAVATDPWLSYAQTLYELSLLPELAEHPFLGDLTTAGVSF